MQIGNVTQVVFEAGHFVARLCNEEVARQGALEALGEALGMDLAGIEARPVLTQVRSGLRAGQWVGRLVARLFSRDGQERLVVLAELPSPSGEWVIRPWVPNTQGLELNWRGRQLLAALAEAVLASETETCQAIAQALADRVESGPALVTGLDDIV